MKGASYFLLSAIALLITIVTISSCNKDKTQLPVVVPVTPEQCADTISFAGFVGPMIEANCSTSGCHDAATASNGYNLEGHLNISTNAQAILNVINHESGVVAMPYFQPKLSDTIIQQFFCWVDQGALDN